MKPLTTALLVLFGMVINSSATADGTWYAGASLGTGEANEITFDDIDDGSALSGSTTNDDFGWKVFAGFSYSEYVAVEVAYVDLGEVSIKAESDGDGIAFDPGPVNASIGTSGLSLALVGSMPINDKFGFQAKLGYFAWSADETLSNVAFVPVSVSRDGSDPMFGLGAVYRPNDRYEIRLEYETFSDIEEVDGTLASLGFSVRF
jgi:OOP family OmpA-OmpF porin